MIALILDGEELFRLCLRDVAAAAAPFHEILTASDDSQFIDQTAGSRAIDLIIFHPATLEGRARTCLGLARRLYPDAALVSIVDPDQCLAPEWENTYHIMRSASIRQMVQSLRRAMKLPAVGAQSATIQPCKNLQTSASQVTSVSQKAALDISRLSFRQKQILAMAADGLPNKEIAARLSIAEGTVKAHMHAIFKVMGVSNRTQAVIRFGSAGPAATDRIAAPPHLAVS